MKDDKHRNKVLKELEKYGNISVACTRAGIDRSTFYRWKEADPEFQKQATKMLRYGREGFCDAAEWGLRIAVKAGKIEAIKYVLSHLSPRYKRQESSAIILHKKSIPHVIREERTFEDLLAEDAERRIDKVEIEIVEGRKNQEEQGQKTDEPPMTS